jgi:hypothetical protein
MPFVGMYDILIINLRFDGLSWNEGGNYLQGTGSGITPCSPEIRALNASYIKPWHWLFS